MADRFEPEVLVLLAEVLEDQEHKARRAVGRYLGGLLGGVQHRLAGIKCLEQLILTALECPIKVREKATPSLLSSPRLAAQRPLPS